MKYQDETYYKNAIYVGVASGTKLADSDNSTDDGYDDVRSCNHIGTVLADSDTNAIVFKPTIVSIAITTEPTKLEYTVGDELDITGMVVKATDSNGAITTPTITSSMVTGFDSSAVVASQTLTVTYGGCTDTFTISVVAAV